MAKALRPAADSATIPTKTLIGCKSHESFQSAKTSVFLTAVEPMADKPKIFLTRELPPESMRILQENSQLTVNPHDRYLTKQEILEGIHGVDGLLCLLTDTIDAEILDANPTLKVVANFAVGFNNIDVDAATARKIPVTNTPGVLTDTTADMAFALLLAAARRVVEGDQFVRTRQWNGWGPLQFLGADVTGATLGIVGMGRIGQAMVPRARGFGMKVVYWNRTRLPEEQEAELGVTYHPLDDVLASSDFVSVHVALNESTRHLIDSSKLALMKNTACIVNTARGPIIDEKSAGSGFARRRDRERGARRLRKRTVAGAGVVFVVQRRCRAASWEWHDWDKNKNG